MLSNLPFGVNIGFGRITNTKTFCLDDLEAVLVADYRTKRAFRWTKENGLTIRPPVFSEGLNWTAEGWELVFEVPDPGSYLPKEEQAARQAQHRQEMLIAAFRSVFPDRGCRQLDCTGLRLLEVVARNSVAYGDARGATFVWDVAPSARILLARDFVVTDAHGDPAFLTDPIIRVEAERGIGTQIKWGDTVLVAQPQDLARLRAYLNK